MDWIYITDTDKINEIIALSNEKAVVLFKHSPRCFISKFALRNFESSFKNLKHTPCYLVDVVSNRAESLSIRDSFSVEHESPQLLIIKDGKAMFNTSHESIDGVETDKLLAQY